MNWRTCLNAATAAAVSIAAAGCARPAEQVTARHESNNAPPEAKQPVPGTRCRAGAFVPTRGCIGHRPEATKESRVLQRAAGAEYERIFGPFATAPPADATCPASAVTELFDDESNRRIWAPHATCVWNTLAAELRKQAKEVDDSSTLAQSEWFRAVAEARIGLRYVVLRSALLRCDLSSLTLFTPREQWVYGLPADKLSELEDGARTFFVKKKAMELDALELGVVRSLGRAVALANAYGVDSAEIDAARRELTQLRLEDRTSFQRRLDGERDPTDPERTRKLGPFVDEVAPLAKPATE
jgi:hypothetical protein